MTVIATDSQRLSNLIKYEYNLATRHCRDEVAYSGAERTFEIGDLVTETGTVPATADDIYGLVVENTSSALTSKIAVLARGDAGVSDAGIKLGALTLADVTEALLAKGIKVLKAV